MVATLDQAFREKWGRVLATLIGFLGDFGITEEAPAGPSAIAVGHWPCDSVPSNPGSFTARSTGDRRVTVVAIYPQTWDTQWLRRSGD